MKKPASGDSSLPYALIEFPGIPFEFTEVLKTKGIVHTAHFLKATQRKADRIRLASDTGIPVRRLEEMLTLCRLTRISGIDPVLSRAFYHAGIRSVNALADESVNSIMQKLTGRGVAYPELTGSLKVEGIQSILKHAKAMRNNGRKNDKQE